MRTAIYDSPITWCREAWQDGRLVAHIAADLLMSPDFRGHRTMHMGLNAGCDFVPGRIIGDREAIDPAQRPAAP